MNQNCLIYSFIPEFGTPYKGKVRDIYDNGDTLTMVASDRISVFDRVLNEPIQDKGRLLTSLSKYWFDQTQDLVPNHLICLPDPNVMMVKKCQPLKVEMIVRGYMAGSLWRDYRAGKREKCGVPLPEGLSQNALLPKPIVTPTTKSTEGHDQDIPKEELIRQGIVTKEQWKQLETHSLKLYERGSQLLKEKGLILVDTKYEFGIDQQGNLTLIDEIHTPDSSRFWFMKEKEKGQEVRFPDKEFARQWAQSLGFSGEGKIPQIPTEVQQKVREGYCQIYQAITGEPLPREKEPVQRRLLSNLKEAKLIRGVFAVLIAGSEKDQPHMDAIAQGLKTHQIPHRLLVGSAHKTPRYVLDLIDQYNASLEPVVFITAAGRSNALSGVVAASSRWPVIACPPFKDMSDYLANIHSSLQMPSQVPAMTVVDPGNAALAAVRILKTMEFI